MYFDEALYLEVQCLLEGRRLFQCGYPKVRRLLEEIWYFPQQKIKRKNMWFQVSNY